ncbi:MAG TPA: 4-hydroxy-tetrahydrodipicolinate synthase [bacterium]|nr:4-hydroxy-tetrahydrodipicolinate synthase [bacterium]
MARRKLFEGSMVALVTPFRKGKVDEKSLRKLVDFHIQKRTDTVIPCGTTGESATLSHEEHRRVMSLVMEYAKGRIPVVCGAGSNNTEEALSLIQYAKKIKAEGVLVVTPYYNKPTQEGLYRHYRFLASKADIPIILYNVPGRTGVSLAPETVARLAKIPTIVAIKEASGNLDQVDQILELCDISVLSGDDGLTLPMMAIGARGVISVTANVVPNLVRDMIHRALEGNLEEARQLHRELYPLSKVLFIETNPIPVKTALGMMKMIKPEFRLPLCEMKKENQAKLKLVLQKMGLLP